MKDTLKIIFTGGGSGGHTMPAIAMIKALQKKCRLDKIDLEILYIGSKNGVEKEIIGKINIPYTAISTGKLRRYFSFKNFIDIFKIIGGFLGSLRIIHKFKPDLLFSTGGFVTVPPVIAAKMVKVPVIIHEQTIDAGLANKINAKFADKICLTFAESKKYFPVSKVELTGIPLREEIFLGSKGSAKARFGFDLTRPTLFFTGGGLGCHILNSTAKEIINRLLEKFNIVFQTGRSQEFSDYDQMIDLKKSLPEKDQKNLFVFDFINDEMKDIYAIADLVIARSGAGTVNELLALKIPAIFIPLSIATNNEQYKNASIMEKLGSAVIIEEKNLNPELLYNTIVDIIGQKLDQMKKNLEVYPFENGTEKILRQIFSLIQ